VFYATGFQSYFLMQWWRMQGTVLAVIPADESSEVGMMVGDFEAKPARLVSGIRDVRAYMLWPEIRDAEAVQDPLGSGESETPRPAQFDEDEQDGILRGLLGDRPGTAIRASAGAITGTRSASTPSTKNRPTSPKATERS